MQMQIMQRGGARLPVELVDQIIELSQHDPHTMRACTSVCRTWNNVARAYVFHRVRVRDSAQLQRLEGVLRANTDIGHRVRELNIGPLCPPTYRESTPWIGRIPKALPAMLPAVQTLRFERLSDAAEYCDSSFFKGLQKFASVTKLIIDDSGLNMPALRAFACAFPRLDEFVVCGLMPLMVNVWSPPPSLHRPRFTKLSISFAVQPSTMMAEFRDWFLKSEARLTVRSLHLAATILDTKAIDTILGVIGPKLEHLSLKLQSLFKSEWEYERIQRGINITPCHNLHSLSLEPTCFAVDGFLSQVSTQHLHTLIFHISIRGGFSPDRSDKLEWLSAQLESRRFRELNAVRFVGDGSVDGEVLEAQLKEVFEKLDGKGVLQVVED